MKKFLTIIVGVSLILPCFSIFSSVYTRSDIYAQAQTAAGGVDKIKTI